MAAEDLDWERSKISNQDLNLMKKLGLMKKDDAIRFPSEESYPNPPMEYRVSFVDHLIRGLSAPIHDFLRGLLFVYGIQLHQLTPNSILHISIFITLCECFLGVPPNWALWKRIFLLRRNASRNATYNIGGVVICVRTDVEYFDVKFPYSVQGWRKKWLYIHEESANSVEHNIVPFDGNAKIQRRRSWDAEASEEEKKATEALMSRIRQLQNTRGEELSGVQITAYFLRIRVQPLQARKNPLWTYTGVNDANRLSSDLSAKDLEKLIRRISRLNKKDPVPSSAAWYHTAPPILSPRYFCLLDFYLVSKCFLHLTVLISRYFSFVAIFAEPSYYVFSSSPSEDGEVEEQAIVAEDNQGSSLHESEVAGSHKSAASHEKEIESEASESTQSLPPAVSPKNKRKRDDAEASGTSKPEKTVPSQPGSAYDPYLETLISSDDEVLPTVDVATRTSTSHTLVASETPVEGEETSPPRQNVDTSTPPTSPRASSPKRARTEIIAEPTLQLSSSSNLLMEDPMIKDLLRIGAQFVGYREYANKAEEKLAEANERANTLAQQLEQSEQARKKAESDAVGARAEADKAKSDAAGVEDLKIRLHTAETSLSDHIAAQSAREEAILKRLKTQSRRFVARTAQEFQLEEPANDPLLDALSFLEVHGSEAREGIDQAKAGLSRLFPYFFPKKEEPATFLDLAKSFNSAEDLGLKMRQENMKVAVESTVALVADSRQTIDWMKKGKMKKFKFGELFKKATTSTGRPSRASTQIRRSYNEDVIAPSFAPEEDHGAPNASSFPCYEFLTNAGILDDFFTLVNRAGLATYVGDERGQYYRLTKVFVENFKFHNTEYEPTVAFKIYDIPVTMKLEEFCCALGIAPVDIPLDSNDVPLTPRKLDIAAMKSHRFVTTDSTIDNMVYRMLFADGNEKEIPLPQPGLFNIDRQSWSLTKEAVEEHMKIQEFHQQHDSENAEPSYDYTVTYPDVSSSTYMEPGRPSSYYEDTTSWGPWE
ncbi:hypothetical protein QYE76_062687 [Lolium multiflorum]|uniref:Transposase (putative) gypsy type domain-containing protein n=1 Tax=Lolium multiflorum TaxID=4521 RepID=A0AAD8W8M5_LOLMU|nr:hypothetical protein QYE76_062687 [Lolium multiflorum]